MREKPFCAVCSKKFTRKSNMLRHMRDIHNALISGLNTNSVFRRKAIQFVPQAKKYTMEEHLPCSGSDGSLDKLFNIVNLSRDYVKSMNVFRTIENLNTRISNYDNEISSIRLHYWMVPKNQISGLSGFVCNHCNQIGFSPIRDIGYDKTIQESHVCEEQDVRRIWACSIRPSDMLQKYDFLASRMIEYLNSIMPGQKYMLADDVSKSFSYLEGKLGLELAKKLSGIPDRYYLCTVDKVDDNTWLSRALNMLGIKITVDDFEVKDFMKTTKSTYAIFKVRQEQISRWIRIKITTKNFTF